MKHVGKQSLHLEDKVAEQFARVLTDQDGGAQHCGQKAVYRRGRGHGEHGVIVAQQHGLRGGVKLVRRVEGHISRGGRREEAAISRVTQRNGQAIQRGLICTLSLG